MVHDGVTGSGPQTWLPQGDPGLPEPTPTPATQPYGSGGYSDAGAHGTPGVAPGAYATPAAYPAQGTNVAPAGYSVPGAFSGAPAYPGANDYHPHRRPPQRPPSPTLAIVGFVLAIFASPIGLVVSIIALVQSRRTGVGRGYAIAGIAIPTVGIVAAIAIPVVLNARLEADDGPRGAFHDMQAALTNGDCAEFIASTTDAMRGQTGILTCSDFDLMIEAVAGTDVDFGYVPVTDVEVTGDVATLWTVERVADFPGEPSRLERVEYRLVLQDGVWLVDWVDLG